MHEGFYMKTLLCSVICTVTLLSSPSRTALAQSTAAPRTEGSQKSQDSRSGNLSLDDGVVQRTPSSAQKIKQPTGTYLGINHTSLGESSTTRTFSNPEILSSLTDTSPATSNPSAQADLRLTPVLHEEINDVSPNDAAPYYGAHNCNYSVGKAGSNGACVGMVPVVTSTPDDEHYGLEAINAIVQVGNRDPLVQAQGIELNMFNNTGFDSNITGAGTFSRGPYFGFSATAGGKNGMIAAFTVQDQRGIGVTGAGWHHGLWVQSVIDDAVLIGTPSGGPAIGLHQMPLGLATKTKNYNSTAIELDGTYWNGRFSSPVATYLSTYIPAGTNPPACFGVNFTNTSNLFTACSDGKVSEGPTSIQGPLTITDGTLKLNSSQVEINGAKAYSGTKTVGPCTLVVQNGLIMNITGC
jgi:hypothetical protein